MRTLVLLVVAFAQSGTSIAAPKASQLATCTSCHTLDNKNGPTFKEIATKYSGKPGAIDDLSSKVRLGSKGTWGNVIMPANPKLSTSDAKELASWVLQQK